MNDQLRKYKRRRQSTGQKDIRFFVEVFPLDPKASLSRALKVTPLKRGLNCNNSYFQRPRFWDFRLHGACVAWFIWRLEIKSMWICSTKAFSTHWKDQGTRNLALKAQQHQILKAKATMALGTSLLILHASGVLDFLLDRTALWVGGLRKVGIDFTILDYIEWLGFRCESWRASFWAELQVQE